MEGVKMSFGNRVMKAGVMKDPDAYVGTNIFNGHGCWLMLFWNRLLPFG